MNKIENNSMILSSILECRSETKHILMTMRGELAVKNNCAKLMVT